MLPLIGYAVSDPDRGAEQYGEGEESHEHTRDPVRITHLYGFTAIASLDVVFVCNAKTGRLDDGTRTLRLRGRHANYYCATSETMTPTIITDARRMS